jgi:hypothetical protein
MKKITWCVSIVIFDLQFSGIIFPEEGEDTDSDSSGYVKQHGRSDRSGQKRICEK